MRIVTVRTLQAREHALATGRAQLDRLAASRLPDFEEKLAQAGLAPLAAAGISVLQVNVGKFCNQTCRHCHVDAGPDRSEKMTRETAELCLRALEASDIPTLDITGGAPELNENFRWMVQRARRAARSSIAATSR